MCFFFKVNIGLIKTPEEIWVRTYQEIVRVNLEEKNFIELSLQKGRQESLRWERQLLEKKTAVRAKVENL